MEAGKMRERIQFLRFVPDRDTKTNQQTKGQYVPAFSCWADVKCTQSAVQDLSGALVYTAVYKFYIRRRDGIAPNMRILWKGREFTLTGPPVDWKSERTGLTLVAREVS